MYSSLLLTTLYSVLTTKKSLFGAIFCIYQKKVVNSARPFPFYAQYLRQSGWVPSEYYGRILRYIASNMKISSVPNALIFDSLTTLFMQAR